MSNNLANRVHEDVQKYIKTKRIDSLVSTLIQDIIKYRPSHVAAFVIIYLFKNYEEDGKLALVNPTIIELVNKLDQKAHSSSYYAKGYNITSREDIQSDLEQYLADKQVQTFLSSIVEKVLLSESQNAIVTMIEQLCKDNPTEALIALEVINPKSNNIKAILSQRVDEMMENVETMSISDEESDNERVSIANSRKSMDIDKTPPGMLVIDSIDPTRIAKDRERLKLTPKQPEISKKLQHLVAAAKMLEALSVDEQELFVRALQGPLTHSRGTEVIKQGDQGDYLYMLESGVMDVFVVESNGSSAGGRKVHSYTAAGEVFGHYALLYNLPRQASCKVASEEAVLWRTEAPAVKLLLAVAAKRNRDCFLPFLTHIPLFKELSAIELGMVADVLRELRFEDGEEVLRQGDAAAPAPSSPAAGDFCLVLDGEAECLQQRGEGTVLLCTLSMGQYFGEAALLTGAKRQATVRAKGSLKVLAVDAVTFQKAMASAHPTLHQRMKEYR